MSNSDTDTPSDASTETEPETEPDTDQQQLAIEDKQRKRFEEEFGKTPEQAAQDLDERDANPKVHDGEDLEIMDPNDLFIVRVSDGEGRNDIKPVMQKVPGMDQALRIKPLVASEYQNYFPIDYDDDAKVAELFNRCLVDLDRDLAPEDVAEGIIAFGTKPVVDCIERASGKSMQEAMEMREMMRMAEMDADQLSGMIQAAQKMDLNSDQLQNQLSSGQT